MHRYKDDIALMGQMGIRAFCFSVSWSRIMPHGRGQVNEDAIRMYRDMIMEMRRHNIEPWLTLYHWELPQALQDEGGWLNPSIVEAFGDYAALVAEHFSDLVSHFLTINEPQCFVGLGYLTGLQAPGHASFHEGYLSHRAQRAEVPRLGCENAAAPRGAAPANRLCAHLLRGDTCHGKP